MGKNGISRKEQASLGMAIIVSFICLAVMVVCLIKMEHGTNTVIMIVCSIALLLLLAYLAKSLYKARTTFTYWQQRYEDEILSNTDELMSKTETIASSKSTIDKYTHEIERLNRLNRNYEHIVTNLRREAGETRNKLDECYKLLEDVKQRAEQSDRLKASFLANVTHELRTPLNPVFGYCAILNDPSVPEERRRHFLGVLQKSCDRFLDTLNDMLYFSQLQSGEINATVNAFDLNAMLYNLKAKAQGWIAAAGKDIELIFPDDLLTKYYITGFEDGYYKLILNLLDNAVKYTDEGSITVTCESLDTVMKIEVSDTGIGFDSSKKDMIFGSFNQSEASLSRPYEGIGLGLSICRGLVNLMNGKMEAEGLPGVGSKFSFEVPLLDTETSEVNMYYEVEKILKNNNDKGPVMIASTLEADYEFVNNFFGSYNLKVLRCRSLEEVGIILDNHPKLNIAIIDLSFSIENGIAAAEKIFTKNPKVRFAFISGKELDEAVLSKIHIYSDFILRRPLNSKSLGVFLGAC